MTSTAPETSGLVPDDARAVLAAARAETEAADLAEARRLQLAVQWAVMHPAESVHDAETYSPRYGGEGVYTLAGPGAPLVAEFSVAEFAAALGVGTEAGKRYLGEAIELRYRLPRLWNRVVEGDLAAWKARRVAAATIGEDLSAEAAGFVDRHVAPVAHRIRPGQLDRLVVEAVARFMPEQAEERRREAADRRHFDVDTRCVTFEGTAFVAGELDLADALDLDDAVRAVAGQLKDLGSTDSLEVRRAVAVGELARRQLALDLQTDPESIERPTSRPVRKTVLYLHLSEAALAGHDAVGRCETTRSPVSAETIRAWCGHPETHLTVKPVIDLPDHVHVDAYEIPHRITERVALRDHSCVFPWCTRPARRLRPDDHGCDCDHIQPWRDDGDGGQTCTCRLAPLCRTHHRLKTHGGWTYTALEPGTYLWTSPYGYHYHRDHTGTADVNADRQPDERD